VVVDGSIEYIAPSQILKSETFKELVKELILEHENDTKISKFLKEIDDLTSNYCHDESSKSSESIVTTFLSLVLTIPESLDYNRDAAAEFVEKLYNFWRERHRFMVIKLPYENSVKRLYYEYKLAKAGDNFASLVRSTYRELLFHINNSVGKVLRQLPSGVQAAFLVDKLEISKKLGFNVPSVWGGVLYPPVVFETWTNKRKGVFPVKKGDVIDKLKLNGYWLGIPIKVGKLKMLIYTQKEFLAHLSGLLNLFKLGDFEEFEDFPDAVVFFGISEKFVKDDEKNGVAYYDTKYNIYAGLIPALKENDYFGYMKKMILTLHNLIQIENGNLPLHGAVAKITFDNGKSKIIALVGDSGAGKSETLEALVRLKDSYVKKIEMIADDMATLVIENGKVVAYGTEIGAFVRLDDLPKEYAYATMDRSIFINPGAVNSRVIVPFGNYDVIITPWKVDYLLYANNYKELEDDEPAVKKFNTIEEAVKVFSEGKRMAKSTTHEKGLTTSYFANPFGAVQKREIHEKIVEKFFKKLFSDKVFVGELYTQLGVFGMEEKGPKIAAKALLSLLRES